MNTENQPRSSLKYATVFIFSSMLPSSQAYMKGFTYPRYAWITYGWYQDEWWTAAVTDNDVNCTDAELASFLDRVLAVQNIPAAENLTAPTDTGLVSQQSHSRTTFRPSVGKSMFDNLPLLFWFAVLAIITFLT